MQHKKDLIDDLDWLTDKISSQVWTLNLGILGTTWTLLIASSNTKLQFQPAEAFPILFLCIVSLTCQMLQYLSGYKNDMLILHRMEKQNHQTFEFDATAFFYRCRNLFFRAKILVTLAAAAFLLWRVFIHFSQS
jgi:hypothetical protein